MKIKILEISDKNKNSISLTQKKIIKNLLSQPEKVEYSKISFGKESQHKLGSDTKLNVYQKGIFERKKEPISSLKKYTKNSEFKKWIQELTDEFLKEDEYQNILKVARNIIDTRIEWKDLDSFNHSENRVFESRNLNNIYHKNKEIDIEKERKWVEDADIIIISFSIFWPSVPTRLTQWMNKILGDIFISKDINLKNKHFIISISMPKNMQYYPHDSSSSSSSYNPITRPFNFFFSYFDMKPIFLIHYLEESPQEGVRKSVELIDRIVLKEYIDKRELHEIENYTNYVEATNQIYKISTEWNLKYSEEMNVAFDRLRDIRAYTYYKLKQIEKNKETIRLKKASKARFTDTLSGRWS